MRHLIAATASALASLVLLAACGGGDVATGTRLLRLEVAPASAAVPAGRTQQFTASAVYSDGTVEDVTDAVAWTSSLPSVAQIDADGLAVTHRAGVVEIRAELAGLARGAAFTVSAPVVESLRIFPDDRALGVNRNVFYDSYASFSDGSERRVTGEAMWSTADAQIARVENGETAFNPKGSVTALAPGETDVIAEYEGVVVRTPVTVMRSAIYGGGDMLAALAYVGSSWFDDARPKNSRRLSNHRRPPDPGSLFASLGQESLVAYCQTGEDLGKVFYVGINGVRADSACGDYSSVPRGFSGILATPDFVAGELPLNGEEYIRTQEIRATGGVTPPPDPVQFPSFAVSIAITYNHPGVSTTLALTSAQLCGIFSGGLTTWDLLSTELANWYQQTGRPPDPIRVVYRQDYSAATFALSNHMSFMQVNNQCPGFQFSTSPWFATMMGNRIDATWIATGSNAESGATVRGTPFTLGYGEAADLALRYEDLRMAQVNGIPPIPLASLSLVETNSRSPRVFPYECVLDNSVGPQQILSSAACMPSTTPGSQQTTFLAGRPVVRRPSTARGNNPCVALVNPDAYANPASDGQPAVYPILSISYLMGYTNGNGSEAPAIRELFLAPYSSNAMLPDGFAPLTGYAPARELIASCVQP